MRIIIVILITIITPELFAQGVVFNNAYDLGDSEVSGDVLANGNGYKIVVGRYGNPFLPVLANLDSIGTLTQFHELEITPWTTSKGYGRSFIQIAEDRFALSGFLNDTVTSHPFLFLFNKQGDSTLLDSFSFKGAFNGICNDDSVIVACGYKDVNGQSDFFICKYDILGNFKQMKTFGLPSKNEVAYSVSIAPDGGYVMSGYRSNGNGDSNPYILKTDSNGNGIWQREIILTEWNDNSTNNCIDKLGNIYLGGAKVQNKLNNGTEYRVSWLTKLKSDGSTIWEKEFNNSSRSSACVGLIQRRNGNLLMLVQSQRDSVNRFLARIYEVDTAGNLLKNIVVEYNPDLNPNGFDYPRSIDTTAHNGFIIAGFATQLPTGQDLWVVKFDSNGCYDYSNNSCTVGIEEFSDLSFQLSVWPNPASDLLHIETASPILEIEVYSQLGELVSSDELVIGSKSESLDTSEFNPGLYFLVVKTENGIESKKVLIRR